MPWTFAHPAAVLPLRKLFRKQLYFLGLVVGSISPDIGYYIGQTRFSHFCHTPDGIIAGSIPVSILTLYFFIFATRYLSVIIPEPHRTATLELVSVEKIDSFFTFIMFTLAIIAGATTHLLWDSFTHPWGWPVAHSDFLSTTWMQFGNLRIHSYTFLQHLSSILGTAILLICYKNWLNKNKLQSMFDYSKEEAWKYKILASTLLASILISTPIAYFHTSRFSGNFAVSAFVVDFAFVITSVLFCLLFFVSFFIRLKK